MHRVLQSLIMLIWGLWLGGLVMLFMAVQSLFITFAADRRIAGDAAAGIFDRFNRFHLGMALAAALAVFLWRMAKPSRRQVLMFMLFVLAGLVAVYLSTRVAPRLERYRLSHATDTPEFKSLHGLSMSLYMAETLLVLAAGLVIPWVSPKTRLPTAPISEVPEIKTD